MYYDFLVEIPEKTGKITKNKRGKTTYIQYTYGRKYLPEKKYNISKRTTIGKMSDENSEMMYPNPNYEKYFPDAVLPEGKQDSSHSGCIRIGAFLIIKKIMDDYKCPYNAACSIVSAGAPKNSFNSSTEPSLSHFIQNAGTSSKAFSELISPLTPNI